MLKWGLRANPLSATHRSELASGRCFFFRLGLLIWEGEAAPEDDLSWIAALETAICLDRIANLITFGKRFVSLSKVNDGLAIAP